MEIKYTFKKKKTKEEEELSWKLTFNQLPQSVIDFLH